MLYILIEVFVLSESVRVHAEDGTDSAIVYLLHSQPEHIRFVQIYEFGRHLFFFSELHFQYNSPYILYNLFIDRNLFFLHILLKQMFPFFKLFRFIISELSFDQFDKIWIYSYKSFFGDNDLDKIA